MGAVSLIIHEEEQFIFDNWATQICAELIESQRLFRHSGRVFKVILCVQRIVSEEFVH